MKRFGLPTLRVALLAVLATAFASTTLHAQDTPAPAAAPAGAPAGHQMTPEQQQKQLDRMTKALSLTPDQVTQIKAIQADNMTKMQALSANGSDAKGNHKAMGQLRKDQAEKTRAVLTDDQKVKYDAMAEKMKDHAKQPHEGGAGTDATPPPAPATPPSA